MTPRELTLLVAACTDSILILQDDNESNPLIAEYQELRAKLMATQANQPLEVK
tara:strand:- start:25749 stop:25907 length:159 start_codon:yes stop_codon:yes gene_type:complete